MANIDAPSGFRVVQAFGSSATNAKVNMYFIPATDSTATFVGDLVKLTGAGDTTGIPVVTSVTAAADVVVGIVVGFVADPNRLDLKHRLASTDRYVFVCDAPEVMLEAQDSGTTAAADVGQNVQVSVATAGNGVTGVSGMQLDGATKATTATHLFQIVKVVQRPNVELGSKGKFHVIFNRHARYPVATGV